MIACVDSTFRYILATTASSKTVQRCEFLKKCKFLDSLPNDLIGKLAGALETMHFADGEYIIRQGDQGNSFFIIEEGFVRCTQTKSNGREIDLMYVNLKENRENYKWRELSN